MPSGIESTLMLLVAATLVCALSVRALTRALGLAVAADSTVERGAQEETGAYVVRAAAANGTHSAALNLEVLKGYWGAVAALALVTTVVALNAVIDVPPTMWTRAGDGSSTVAACRASYDTWFSRVCLLSGLGLFGYTMFMRLRLGGLIAHAYAPVRAAAAPRPAVPARRRAESWLEGKMLARRSKAEDRRQFVDSLFDPIDPQLGYDMAADDDFGRRAPAQDQRLKNRRGWPLG